MPWAPADASKKTKKAKSPKAKRMWAHIADNLLKHGTSEGEAIKEANGVIKKRT